MATGLARGAKDRGKRIAFGDRRKIIWGPWSEPMFRYNPNIAKPGSENDPDIDWIEHYKGKRLYNNLSPDRTRWVWNMDFRPIPGELFFIEAERQILPRIEPGFVLIEPNVPWHKSVAANKDWGVGKYQFVADRLMAEGHRLLQFGHGRNRLRKVKTIVVPEFRQALAILSRAALYIGPEGGLHHGAAAVGIPAVVLFGGFIPPEVTGYTTHTNLTGGAAACGSLKTCKHCRKAMAKIGPDEVYEAAVGYLRG